METTATRTADSKIKVTFADGTVLHSTKGKRAANATHVIITRWEGSAPGIYGLRSNGENAAAEAAKFTVYNPPMVANPATECYVVPVS